MILLQGCRHVSVFYGLVSEFDSLKSDVNYNKRFVAVDADNVGDVTRAGLFMRLGLKTERRQCSWQFEPCAGIEKPQNLLA